VVTEAGSYSRLIDFCITQLKVQGPSRTCNESKEEEEEVRAAVSLPQQLRLGFRVQGLVFSVEGLVFRV